jgi:hypothetical protein
MNFVKYLLVVSMIVTLYYLYTYITLFENFPFQNVIPETENDYPPITKQNLRGMGKKVKNNVKNKVKNNVKNNVKINIIDTLISEHSKSTYNGVNLVSGQDNINSFTVSLNCDKQLCRFFGYPVAINDREIILHT